MKVYVRTRTIEQLSKVISKGLADCLIIDHEIAEAFIVEYESKKITGSDAELFFALPQVLRENKKNNVIHFYDVLMEKHRERVSGFVAENIDDMGFLVSNGYKGTVIAGEMLYSYNHAAIQMIKNSFVRSGYISPPELTIKEMKKVEEKSGEHFIYKVYGHQMLMTTAQCLYKNKNGCLEEKISNDALRKQDHAALKFKNDKNDTFIALTNCRQCLNTIYSLKPTFMLDRLEEISAEELLVDFTVEDGAETERVLDILENAITGKSGIGEVRMDEKKEITRGHYYKGIY